MDDQFLKTIIDSVPGHLSAERIENFKIRREAQLRRLMAWYGVNRDRAKEIQAEMGYPFLGSPVWMHNKPDGVGNLLTSSGIHVELYFLIVIRKGMPYDLARFLYLVKYHHGRARYNHLIRISFDFWYIMCRINLEKFICHLIDR